LEFGSTKTFIEKVFEYLIIIQKSELFGFKKSFSVECGKLFQVAVEK